MFLIFWLSNPYLIESFCAEEVDGIRKKIADLCLSNFIEGRETLSGLENLGKKDDLIFQRALVPFMLNKRTNKLKI